MLHRMVRKSLRLSLIQKYEDYVRSDEAQAMFRVFPALYEDLKTLKEHKNLLFLTVKMQNCLKNQTM